MQSTSSDTLVDQSAGPLVGEPATPLAGGLTQSLIVRAGAGAGKTTALTEQVLMVAQNFMLEHKRLPRIVATTFTKKATQELKERVVLLALRKHPELLEFANSSAHLKISTIHGILDQYLRQYGSFLNLDPNFTVTNASQASLTARRLIRQILVQHEQRESFQLLLDQFSIRKLEVLARSYFKNQIRFGEIEAHDFNSLLALMNTAGKELAGEIREVVDGIRAEEQSAKWLEYADAMDRISQILIYESWEKACAKIADLTDNLPAARAGKNITITEVTNELKKRVERKLKDLVEDESLRPEAMQAFAEVYQKCALFFKEFSGALLLEKIRSSQLEIDDLELFALKCARENPESAVAFANEWDYWLIDEYQDTSPVQVELIERLAGTRPQYIVGDPQQSIYLFRGARSEVFQNREKQILASEGLRIDKIKNYRSRPELLEFFNDFFSKLKVPFSPMESVLKEGMTLDPAKPVAQFAIVENEYDAIVARVHGLLAQGARLDEICVLARTNKILFEVAAQLTTSGLANHVHVAGGFFDRREVQDALALYKFLINPHDNLNLLILLRSPWFFVSDQQLVDLLRSRPVSNWSHFLEKSSDLPAIRRLADYFEQTSVVGLGLNFQNILMECGLFEAGPEVDRCEANLWKLVALIREEEQKPGFNPLQFLNQLKSNRSVGEDYEGDAIVAVEPNRINLMTVHSSKGLQFRHVIVPKMEKRPRSPMQPDFLFDEDEKRWSSTLAVWRRR